MTPQQVRRILGDDAYPDSYEPAVSVPTEQTRRYGTDLKAFIARMSRYEAFIIVRYLEGYSPERIASFLSAHPETVRIRIRNAGLFIISNRRGRPAVKDMHPLVRHYREAVARTDAVAKD